MGQEIADRNNPSQQAKVDTYGSLYTVLVDSSGNVIKATLLVENRLGSECSGTDGTTGRVLILQNTSESGAPVAIWNNDQLINPADYTVVHKSASSTVTFDNIEVYNADTIRGNYYV